MGTFGKRNSERPAGGGDIFIKTFKNPRTLVWFLEDDPKDWVEYKQHFDRKAEGKGRGWPCAIHEGGNDCVGCEFPADDETDDQDPGMKVRATSSRWVFPVVDEKGYVSLYQCGYKLWKALCELYEEYDGTIADRWYAIRRSGETFNDIAYTPTRTDDAKKPEVKVAVPGPEYISQILGKQYEEALERYGYEPGAERDEAQPDPDPVERTGDAVKDGLAERKAAAAKKGAKPKQEEPASDEAQASSDMAASDGWTPNVNLDDLSRGEIADWLESRPEAHGGAVEFPPRAGRPVLLGLAKKAQEELAGAKSGTWVGKDEEPPY